MRQIGARQQQSPSTHLQVRLVHGTADCVEGHEPLVLVCRSCAVAFEAQIALPVSGGEHES